MATIAGKTRKQAEEYLLASGQNYVLLDVLHADMANRSPGVSLSNYRRDIKRGVSKVAVIKGNDGKDYVKLKQPFQAVIEFSQTDTSTNYADIFKGSREDNLERFYAVPGMQAKKDIATDIARGVLSTVDFTNKNHSFEYVKRVLLFGMKHDINLMTLRDTLKNEAIDAYGKGVWGKIQVAFSSYRDKQKEKGTLCEYKAEIIKDMPNAVPSFYKLCDTVMGLSGTTVDWVELQLVAKLGLINVTDEYLSMVEKYAPEYLQSQILNKRLVENLLGSYTVDGVKEQVCLLMRESMVDEGVYHDLQIEYKYTKSQLVKALISDAAKEFYEDTSHLEFAKQQHTQELGGINQQIEELTLQLQELQNVSQGIQTKMDGLDDKCLQMVTKLGGL